MNNTTPALGLERIDPSDYFDHAMWNRNLDRTDEAFSEFTLHRQKTILSPDGVHGLRFWSAKLQAFDGTEWIDIGAGTPLPSIMQFDSGDTWDSGLKWGQ